MSVFKCAECSSCRIVCGEVFDELDRMMDVKLKIVHILHFSLLMVSIYQTIDSNAMHESWKLFITYSKLYDFTLFRMNTAHFTGIVTYVRSKHNHLQPSLSLNHFCGFHINLWYSVLGFEYHFIWHIFGDGKRLPRQDWTELKTSVASMARRMAHSTTRVAARKVTSWPITTR